MREVRLPSPELPPLTRSAAACLAAILELGPDDVPVPPAGTVDPWTVWRGWLARRGLGLVPVREPARFGWPGPWIALLRSDVPGGRVAAIAFGVPPGLVWHPLGGPETFGDVDEGYLVAPADAALWRPRERPPSRLAGRVEALALAPAAEAPMVRVERVTAHAGRGLEGDRYAAGRGTFSNPDAVGLDLTLVEAEAVEALDLAPEAARRNVVTRGIDLDGLVGRRFTVGEVVCVGQRLCEPCAHLQRLTRPGVLRGLVHWGGLRADILAGGEIRVGDAIRPVPGRDTPADR